MRINTITCTVCEVSFASAKRSDTKYCDKCRRTKSPTALWGSTDRGRAMRAARHREIREKAYSGYGGSCTCCGESEFEFLCLDHVNGGGAADRRKRSTWQIARYVIDNKWPDSFTVLCHNCNLAKGFFGMCPHKKRIS